MDLAALTNRLGDEVTLALAGLAIGLAFGALAQRSRFCLRAATIEFARGELGPKVAIWLLAFFSAVAATQTAIVLEWLDVGEARQLTARGSISGAIIGGVMFGAGMILARGCASRLLVLSATGNLRALLTGLVLTVVAQASLRGILAPSREYLAGLWTVEGGDVRNLLTAVGTGPLTGALLGFAGLALGLSLARRRGVAPIEGLSAAALGTVVAAGWLTTYGLSQVAFEPVRVGSVSFTGPAADTLMAFINERSIHLSFDLGLVPGVFAGSLLAALAARELSLQGFSGGPSMLRYIAGAVLMGYGGMLAGGCAVGAGVTGGAIFAVTAWLALAAMWAGAMLTDRIVDGPAPAAHEPAPARP
ncbi:MAG: YeeE/YedE family protein [Rhizobiales bacterium]|nr:YeeE/YedE family protein [Hyphomicrobiales bacterium]